MIFEPSLWPQGGGVICSPPRIKEVGSRVEDGQRLRARIVSAIEDHEEKIEDNPTRIQFLCALGDEETEEIITYNEILNHIEADETEETTTIWKFKRITAHEGPLTRTHPSWKGSPYNVMGEWENGEITSEPLAVIAADDPITCAVYAKENVLLELESWNGSNRLPKDRRSFSAWLIKPSFDPTVPHRNTNTDTKYRKTTCMMYVWMRRLETRNGKTPPN
eukprot:scaffold1362_cov61-Attheya_sp.AAC.4